jgi:peptide/nickel transport system permease protein
VLVLPSLPLAVVVAAYLPPSPFSVGAVLVLTGWAWNARVVRAQCLALRRREFVLAARMVGESPARVVFVELLPNLGSLLLSQFIGATTYALGAHVGLEFLGLGEVSRVTWGSNLYWASNDQALLTGAWWTFVPTGLCVAAVGGALALLQGAVDEALHPQLRAEQPWRAFLGRAGRVPPPDGATPVVRQ